MRVIKEITGPLRENCYFFINDKNEAVIIDPGDEAARLKEIITVEHLMLKAVLITHAHFDHFGAVEELRKEYVVPVYVSKGEYEMMQNPRQNLSSVYSHRHLSTKADMMLEEGNHLDFGEGLQLEVLSVPGHSPSGLCFYAKEAGCIFTGDTLFRQSVGRVDLYPGDPSDLVRNIIEKILILPEETIVYAGHGMNTTIGKEKESNPFLNMDARMY